MLTHHRDGLLSSSFLAWSSIAQSVCQQAFSLLVNRYLRPWVRILPSAEEDNLSPFDSNIACLCQSIEINNNKHVYRQSQVRKPIGNKVEWAECLLIMGTGCRVQVFLAWSSIAQSVCQQAFSLLVNRYLRPWVRILPSAEEDNLSPFDSNIACLCQSIEINNNKHVYRQSQVRKPIGNKVEWAECLLIMGTGCRVQVFLAWSSIAQSVCQQAFSLLVNRYLRPWVRILPSAEEDNLSPFDSNIAYLCQSIEINNNKHVCMYVCVCACVGACVCMYVCVCLSACMHACIHVCMYVCRFVSRHSVCWRIGVWDPLGSNPAFSRGRQLVSFRFEYRLPVPEHRN